MLFLFISMGENDLRWVFWVERWSWHDFNSYVKVPLHFQKGLVDTHTPSPHTTLPYKHGHRPFSQMWRSRSRLSLRKKTFGNCEQYECAADPRKNQAQYKMQSPSFPLTLVCFCADLEDEIVFVSLDNYLPWEGPTLHQPELLLDFYFERQAIRVAAKHFMS